MTESDSITVTLRKWLGSYEVVHAFPNRCYVYGEDCNYTLKQAEEVYNRLLEAAKQCAAERAMFD